jgi:aspartyl-tRNA(Asn)/glutamyl-tRNA(Gln) amidotransferase subunit C
MSESDPITPEIFDHLVQLAAFEFDEEQAAYLRNQMNGQLHAIRDLEAIELPEDLEITSHGVSYTPEIRTAEREDEILPSDKADAILEQAPEVDDRYLIVPDLPHTELE